MKPPVLEARRLTALVNLGLLALLEARVKVKGNLNMLLNGRLALMTDAVILRLCLGRRGKRVHEFKKRQARLIRIPKV